LYGETPDQGAAEESPIHPASPYGVSKFCLEQYIGFYARSRGLQYTILRYANVFGPRQIPESEAGVVAIFIGSLLNGKTPTIYGDGGQRRDFVYVGDVAQANLRALANTDNAVVNIGTGRGTTIQQLLELLQGELTTGLKPRYAPKRPGEIFQSIVDNSRARNILGWQPQTSLSEGLKKTIAWQKTMDKR
ncbi:MAG: GDP-mannose 4,6-dehydratase, partial [Deltaproteobacteria bacterium]|nr:GDP-mannose 4,6-dehydratase [Deltaproteobacteria bacterium]